MRHRTNVAGHLLGRGRFWRAFFLAFAAAAGTTTRLCSWPSPSRRSLCVRASFPPFFQQLGTRRATSREALPARPREDTPSWESARRGDSQGGPSSPFSRGAPLNGSLNGETNADFFVAPRIQDAAQEGLLSSTVSASVARGPALGNGSERRAPGRKTMVVECHKTISARRAREREGERPPPRKKNGPGGTHRVSGDHHLTLEAPRRLCYLYASPMATCAPSSGTPGPLWSGMLI